MNGYITQENLHLLNAYTQDIIFLNGAPEHFDHIAGGIGEAMGIYYNAEPLTEPHRSPRTYMLYDDMNQPLGMVDLHFEQIAGTHEPVMYYGIPHMHETVMYALSFRQPDSWGFATMVRMPEDAFPGN
jgi:hypothetical protein